MKNCSSFAAFALTIVALGACVEPLLLPEGGLIACADNAACPPGAACAVAQQLCVPDSGTCVVDGNVVDDGGRCALAGAADAICVAGVCREPTCGDGVVSGSEACDRGSDNSDEADACRADCVVPFCGDGIIDTGESCDVDGDLSCDACVLLCEPGLGNCNGDGRDGCECSLVGFPGEHWLHVAVHDGQAVGLRATGVRDEVEVLDVNVTDATTTVRLANALGDFFPEDLLSVDGHLVVVARSLVGFDIAFLSVADGFRVIHAEDDFDAPAPGVCTQGSRIYVRTDEAIVGFDAADGDNEAVVARPAREDPDRALETTIACVGDDVVWIERGTVVRAPMNGTRRDEAPTLVVAADGRFVIGVFADDADLLVIDSETVERVTSTATTLLARLPDNFTLDPFVPKVVVAGQRLLMSAENRFGGSAIFAVPRTGGTPTMITASSDEFAAAGGALIAVARDGNLTALRLTP